MFRITVAVNADFDGLTPAGVTPAVFEEDFEEAMLQLFPDLSYTDVSVTVDRGGSGAE